MDWSASLDQISFCQFLDNVNDGQFLQECAVWQRGVRRSFQEECQTQRTKNKNEPSHAHGKVILARAKSSKQSEELKTLDLGKSHVFKHSVVHSVSQIQSMFLKINTDIIFLLYFKV